MMLAIRSIFRHSLAGAAVILSGLFQSAFGQVLPGGITTHQYNSIPTSVPFLTIAPDGRATGMGDVGVASAPDLHSQHWNVAKYAFLEEKGGIGMTYTSWVPKLLPDVILLYAAGAYRINDRNALSGSFRYFYPGTYLQGYPPQEWALDVGYARKLAEGFSGGIVLRYIRSDLSDAPESQAGTSLAGDLGLYYQRGFMIGEREARWAAGLSLSNMGPRVAYSTDTEGLPIPSNFRAGGRFGIDLNQDHAIDFHLDLNKLMVPTQPAYKYDSLSGEMVIVRGKAPPQSVMAGMIQSFYDAPGVLKEDGTYSTFKEEIREFTLGTGIEYRFRNLLALRTGYFHENVHKGNRKYFTFGLGSRYRFISLDVSYLLPVDSNSYLKNVFRITLVFTI
jgi:hypothetical protein